MQDIKTGGFQLIWPGKDLAPVEADTPAGAVIPEGILPAGFLDKGVDLAIKGDNLDALKLLKRELSGRVDFIYIDPPYNSGKNMAYRNNFTESGADFTLRTGGSRDDLRSRRHSLWLSFMYPRLLLARELLAEDGVIYISIDDSELFSLGLLADEIFGEENRAGIITWVKKKKGSHLSRAIRSLTEYILVYGRNIKKLDLYGEDAYRHKWQPLIKRVNREKVLFFKAGTVESTLKKNFYPKGTYGRGTTAVELLEDIHVKDGVIVSDFSIRARTVWTQEKLDGELALGTRVSIRSEKMGPSVFRHNQTEKKKAPSTILDGRTGAGANEDAWNEMRALFGTDLTFAYPKPVSLIKYLVKSAVRHKNDGIFLDFFAGTGTTGQAVWEANREDGKNRRFILVQKDEALERPVETEGIKLRTMWDICRCRLEKVKDREKLQDLNLTCRSAGHSD